MSQIGIFYAGVDLYDLELDEDDGERLKIDETLRTAVLISLLTDRRAEPSEAPDPSDLGGWWGDTYPDEPGDAVGSKLWTLAGRGRTPETLNLAEQYIREALAWMVTDRIVADAESIVVELEFTSTHALAGRIGILQPASTAPEWVTTWQRSLEG